MAKLTRKSYKRKKIAFAAVILGGVALVSSGFAAWVLSTNAKADTSGKVTVGQVEKGSLKLTVDSTIKGTKVDLDNGHFDFDTLEDDNTGRVRRNKEQTTFENLSITYAFTVMSPIENFSDLTIQLSASKGEDTNVLQTAASSNYITLPDCYGKLITLKADGTKTIQNSTDGVFKQDEAAMFKRKELTQGVKGTDENGKDVVYKYQWEASYTINFKWGTLFNGTNPGLYYDSDEAGRKISDKDVETALNALHDALDGVSYTVNFVASVN